MVVFGGVVAFVGVVLFHVALGMTLRANPASRVPVGRNAAAIPDGSAAVRGVGGVLLVLGAVLLSTNAWYWPFLVALAGPVTALAVITFHNRKVTNPPTRRRTSLP